jgi:hypothetical protein
LWVEAMKAPGKPGRFVKLRRVSPPSLGEGSEIGGYRIEPLLGRGGMGSVYMQLSAQRARQGRLFV